MIVGTMASPSSPSVRFTALLEPIITNAPNSGKANPSGISTSLNTGTVSPDPNGSRVSQTIQADTATPSTACTISLPRPDSPRNEALDSLM
jgi:hypothetical protein